MSYLDALDNAPEARGLESVEDPALPGPGDPGGLLWPEDLNEDGELYTLDYRP